jgi:hypothetical protein
MSFNIDWQAVISDPHLLSHVRSHIQSILDEKVNTKQPGAADDGTRVYLLELFPGSVPPLIELVGLGVDGQSNETNPIINAAVNAVTSVTAAASAAIHAAASVASSLANTASTLHLPPRTPESVSARASPFRSLSASPALSASDSFSGSDAGSSLSASASFSRRVPRICNDCGGRIPLPPPAVPSMPAFSVSGRIAYRGDLYVTLQVQRQVNPYVSSRGLLGRLGRAHLPSSSMDWPLTVQLWVRLGELHIDAQVQASYTPAIKPILTVNVPMRSAAASPLPSPSAGMMDGHSQFGTPIASAVRHNAGLSSSQFLSPPSNIATPVPLSHTPQSAVPSLRRSGMFSSPAPSGLISPIPRSASSSSTPNALHTCHCALNASMSSSAILTSTGGAAASSASASQNPTSPVPARVSILLSSNPLEHYSLTTALDGSPAGRKLLRMADKGVSSILASLIGHRRTFDLPEFPSFKQIKQNVNDKKNRNKQHHAKTDNNGQAATTTVPNPSVNST